MWTKNHHYKTESVKWNFKKEQDSAIWFIKEIYFKYKVTERLNRKDKVCKQQA